MVSPMVALIGDTSLKMSPMAPMQNTPIFRKEDTLSHRGHQVSSRAREDEPMPAWVTEAEPPVAVGSSDAALGRDEESDDVFVVD